MIKRCLKMVGLGVAWGASLSGCASSAEEQTADPTLTSAEPEAALVYSETFDNSITIEYLQESDGSIGVGVSASADAFDDSESVSAALTVALKSSSAVEAYKAVKELVVPSEDAGEVPSAVAELDATSESGEESADVQAGLPEAPVPGSETAAEALAEETLGGVVKAAGTTASDDAAVDKVLATLPGEMRTKKFNEAYSTYLEVTGYHPFYLSFNRSTKTTATFKHYKHESGLWTLAFTKSVQPRYYYGYHQLKLLTKQRRDTVFSFASPLATDRLDLAATWDSTPVAHTSNSYFEAIAKDKLIFVDFTMNNCPYCGTFEPTFEATSQKWILSNYMFVELNVDHCFTLWANDYADIHSFPTNVAMYNGEIIATYSGNRTEDDFSNWCYNTVWDNI